MKIKLLLSKKVFSKPKPGVGQFHFEVLSQVLEKIVATSVVFLAATNSITLVSVNILLIGASLCLSCTHLLYFYKQNVTNKLCMVEKLTHTLVVITALLIAIFLSVSNILHLSGLLTFLAIFSGILNSYYQNKDFILLCVKYCIENLFLCFGKNIHEPYYQPSLLTIEKDYYALSMLSIQCSKPSESADSNVLTTMTLINRVIIYFGNKIDKYQSTFLGHIANENKIQQAQKVINGINNGDINDAIQFYQVKSESKKNKKILLVKAKQDLKILPAHSTFHFFKNPDEIFEKMPHDNYQHAAQFSIELEIARQQQKIDFFDDLLSQLNPASLPSNSLC